MADDGNNGKRIPFSTCSSCKRTIQWARDDNGKFRPMVPGSKLPHKCRQADYGAPPKTRDGYI